MSRKLVITQEKFDKTLAWLGQDREAAGKKYEDIRQSLIKIFIWRGISDAEDLADEAVNRVMSRIEELAASYTGDPALYFFGVAKKLLIEHQRGQKLRGPLPEIAVNEDHLQKREETLNRIYECLSRCMKELKPADGELFTAYYSCDNLRKIDQRRGLAWRNGIRANTLRIRVHRIRATLQECINRCLELAV